MSCPIKYRLAFFSPMPPIKSGISDYSEALLDHLTKVANIEVIIDDYEPTLKIREKFDIVYFREYETQNRIRPFDLNVYQIGNNPYHHYMHPFILKHPGIIVLHDYVLHHSLAAMTLVQGDIKGYVDEMVYNYGEIGRELAQLRCKGIWTEYQHFLYPLNKRYIESSLGIIVHSEFIKNQILMKYEEKPVIKVNMGLNFNKEVNQKSKTEVRKRLGLKADQFIIGVFGFVTPMKRIDYILKAFCRIIEEIPHALLLIVGSVEDKNVYGEIEKLKHKEAVKITGYVTREVFDDFMAVTDIACNIRFPTAGETSASLLNLMKNGVPVVIFNYCQFSEIPDDCCIKIDIDDEVVCKMASRIVQLAQNSELMKQIGQNAKRYIEENHRVENIYPEYIRFVGDIYKNRIRSKFKEEVIKSTNMKCHESIYRLSFYKVFKEMGLE